MCVCWGLLAWMVLSPALRQLPYMHVLTSTQVNAQRILWTYLRFLLHAALSSRALDQPSSPWTLGSGSFTQRTQTPSSFPVPFFALQPELAQGCELGQHRAHLICSLSLRDYWITVPSVMMPSLLTTIFSYFACFLVVSGESRVPQQKLVYYTVDTIKILQKL